MLANNPIAVEYTMRQLLNRAGGDPRAKIAKISYGAPCVLSDDFAVFIEPCAATAWEDLLKRPSNSLDWIEANQTVPPGSDLPFSMPVPVLFWGESCQDGSKPFAERLQDGTVVFNADIVAATFFMLSRWEETAIPVRDEHERFPATASVAYQQSFLDRPVVDEYALILREWLKALFPNWKPKPLQFSVKLSYDVDAIYPFPNLKRALRILGASLFKRRDLKQAWQTGMDALWQVVAPEQASHFRNLRFLAKLSKMSGLETAFYFMAAQPGPLDNEYDPRSPFVKRCIQDLRRQGFEIGFHPGYHTLNNPGRLAEEKARLDTVLRETQYGGRQHYLRFQVPDTWRHWEQVGLTYDSTMAYADHEGFRCGTCHLFRPFDVVQNRELNLLELPLIAMDATLRGYRKLTPEQGERRILELARRSKQVGGKFTLLWHISGLSGKWRPWRDVYQRVVKTLVQMKQETKKKNRTP